ncbi:hypothetical protein GGU45_003322 [Niabella hirudinis]
MKSRFKQEFEDEYKKVKVKVDLAAKRLYVIAFNIYAWFWLIRQIFVRHSTNIEDYLLWFFTTAGMYYFVLDNNDIFFKTKKTKI